MTCEHLCCDCPYYGFLGDCPALLSYSFISQGQGFYFTLIFPQTNPPSRKQVEIVPIFAHGSDEVNLGRLHSDVFIKC